MSRTIAGVNPVLHTPFLDNDDIDYETLQKQIDWAIELGVSGVCSAMVSELFRLTADERIELNRTLVKQVAGRANVIASVGAESTRQSLIFARDAVEAGADAIMAIPPVMTALPEEMTWRYFCELADAVEVSLIVQDASSYVGAAIPTSFYVRLLDKYGPEKILFKPEGSPIGPNISALRDASEGAARMFDGSGGMLLVDAYRRGVAGTMPGMDLLDGIVALWNALELGDDQTAYRISFPICALVALQTQAGLDGFLAIEKYLMVRRGLFSSDRRREPHAWSRDEETRAEVDRLFAMLQQVLQSLPAAQTGSTE